VLLVREAGGTCIDFDGSENYFASGNLVAANLKVAAQMVARIKPLAGPKSMVVGATSPAIEATDRAD